MHNFTANIFEKNSHQQVEFTSRKYSGSLVEVESGLAEAKFIFEKNVVKYNSFIGKGSALISIDGPLMEIRDNEFSYNGQVIL